MEKKRNKAELVIIVLLVVAALVVFAVSTQNNIRATKENALVDELRAVRSAVQLYVVFNKSLPKDLVVLTKENYTVGNRSRAYLTGISVNSVGEPVDVFGKPFVYSPQTGQVVSGAVEYGQW